MATEGWGVVASLIVYPPFAGAAVTAITFVVSFGFAVTPEYNEEGIYTVRFCIQVVISNFSFIVLHCSRYSQEVSRLIFFQLAG